MLGRDDENGFRDQGWMVGPHVFEGNHVRIALNRVHVAWVESPHSRHWYYGTPKRYP